MEKLKSLLVANRGEIATRIIKTAKVLPFAHPVLSPHLSCSETWNQDYRNIH